MEINKERKQSKRPKRTAKQWIQDVWLAMTGKTFFVVDGCCHSCDSDFRIEFYQDVLRTMHSPGIGIGRADINTIWYFPAQRVIHEKLNGDNYRSFKECNPTHNPYRERSHWNKKCNWSFDSISEQYKKTKAKNRERAIEKAKQLLAQESINNAFNTNKELNHD